MAVTQKARIVALKPLVRMAQIILVLFAVAIVVDFVSIVANGALIGHLGSIDAGEASDEEWYALLEHRSRVGMTQGWVMLACAAAFLIWLHRAHWNLIEGGLQPSDAPAWAVGWFVIPIFNLYKPFGVMNELCAGSDTLARDGDRSYWYESRTPLVYWWWGLFILLPVVDAVAGLSFEEGAATDTLRTAFKLMILSDVMGIVGTVLGAVLVRRVTTSQEQARVRSAGSRAA